MHVVGTIIDKSTHLVGLVIRGKQKEFGGVGNEIVEKRVPLQSIPRGFRTSEVCVNNGVIELVGNFRLSHLDRMELLDGNKVTAISNDIEITKVVKDGDNIVGFEVTVCKGSISRKLRYEDTIQKAGYFKPTNFVVRDINGKEVICGKQGVARIEDFPVIQIGSTPERSKVAESVKNNEVKQEKVKSREKVEPIGNIDVGIIDIIDYVASVGGSMAMDGTEKYRSNSADNTSVDYEGFRKSTKIELAAPLLKYGEKKINATLNFRKYGEVTDETSGKKYGTYINAAKSVFNNGEKTLDTIAVVVDESNLGWFTQHGIEYKIKMTSDELKSQHVLSELNRNLIEGKVLALINLKKVGIMCDNDRDKSVLSNEELIDSCMKMYTYKLMLKFVGSGGELVRGIKEKVGKQAYAEIFGNGIAYQFRGLDKEEQNRIRELGIDIVTGDYKITVTKSKDSTATSNDIMIDYMYQGMDYTKVTGKQMLEAAGVGFSDDIPLTMIQLIQSVTGMADDKEKLEQVKSIKERAEDGLRELNRKLWKHRAAMYMIGGGKYIHTHDRDSWEQNTRSKAKKYKEYINTSVDGLVARVSGIEI